MGGDAQDRRRPRWKMTVTISNRAVRIQLLDVLNCIAEKGHWLQARKDD
ncbi:hypothetical protein AKJ16_DCAP16387 [Drosera capensis]